MTVSFLHSSAQGFTLIFCSIPIHQQVGMLAIGIEILVHLVYDFFIGTALEGDHFTLVIESYAKAEA